jgi:hypothetical protein
MKTMSNVLPFPIRPADKSKAKQTDGPAEVIDFASVRAHVRARARCLRLATGVYFVSRTEMSPEDYTAA